MPGEFDFGNYRRPAGGRGHVGGAAGGHRGGRREAPFLADITAMLDHPQLSNPVAVARRARAGAARPVRGPVLNPDAVGQLNAILDRCFQRLPGGQGQISTLATRLKALSTQLSEKSTTARRPIQTEYRTELFRLLLDRLRDQFPEETPPEDAWAAPAADPNWTSIFATLDMNSLVGQGVMVEVLKDPALCQHLLVFQQRHARRVASGPAALKASPTAHTHVPLSGLQRMFSDLCDARQSFNPLDSENPVQRVFKQLCSPKVLESMINAEQDPYQPCVLEFFEDEKCLADLLKKRLHRDLSEKVVPWQAAGGRVPRDYFTHFAGLVEPLDQQGTNGNLSEILARHVVNACNMYRPGDEIPADLTDALKRSLITTTAVGISSGDIKGAQARLTSIFKAASPPILETYAHVFSAIITPLPGRVAPAQERESALVQKSARLILEGINSRLGRRAEERHTLGLKTHFSRQIAATGLTIAQTGRQQAAEMMGVYADIVRRKAGIKSKPAAGIVQRRLVIFNRLAKQCQSLFAQLDQDPSGKLVSQFDDLIKLLNEFFEMTDTVTVSASDRALLVELIGEMKSQVQTIASTCAHVRRAASFDSRAAHVDVPEEVDLDDHRAEGLKLVNLAGAEDGGVEGENAHQQLQRLLPRLLSSCRSLGQETRDGNRSVFHQLQSAVAAVRPHLRDADLGYSTLETQNEQLYAELSSLQENIGRNAPLSQLNTIVIGIGRLIGSQRTVLTQLLRDTGIRPSPNGVYATITRSLDSIDRTMISLHRTIADLQTPGHGREEIARAGRTHAMVTAGASGGSSGDQINHQLFLTQLNEWAALMKRTGDLSPSEIRQIKADLSRPDVARNVVAACCTPPTADRPSELNAEHLTVPDDGGKQHLRLFHHGRTKMRLPDAPFVGAVMGAINASGANSAAIYKGAAAPDNADALVTPRYRPFRELLFAIARAYTTTVGPDPATNARLNASAAPIRQKRVVDRSLRADSWAGYRDEISSRNLVQNANYFTAASLAVLRKMDYDRRSRGANQGHIRQIAIDFVDTYCQPTADRDLQFSREQRDTLTGLHTMLTILLDDDGLPPGIAAKVTRLLTILARPTVDDVDEVPDSVTQHQSDRRMKKYGLRMRRALVNQHFQAARRVESWFSAYMSNLPDVRRPVEDLLRLQGLLGDYRRISTQLHSQDLRRVAPDKKAMSMQHLARLRRQIEDILLIGSIFDADNLIVLEEELRELPEDVDGHYIDGEDGEIETALRSRSTWISGNFDYFLRHQVHASDKRTSHKQLEIAVRIDRLLKKRDRLADQWGDPKARVLIDDINEKLIELYRQLPRNIDPVDPIETVLTEQEYPLGQAKKRYSDLVKLTKQAMSVAKNPAEKRFLSQNALFLTREFLKGIKARLTDGDESAGAELARHSATISREINSMFGLCINTAELPDHQALLELMDTQESYDETFGEVFSVNGIPEGPNQRLYEDFCTSVLKVIHPRCERAKHSYLRSLLTSLRSRHIPPEFKIDILMAQEMTLRTAFRSLNEEEQRQLAAIIGQVLEDALIMHNRQAEDGEEPFTDINDFRYIVGRLMVSIWGEDGLDSPLPEELRDEYVRFIANYPEVEEDEY